VHVCLKWLNGDCASASGAPKKCPLSTDDEPKCHEMSEDKCLWLKKTMTRDLTKPVAEYLKFVNA
jgi:hypothetical protein